MGLYEFLYESLHYSTNVTYTRLLPFGVGGTCFSLPINGEIRPMGGSVNRSWTRWAGSVRVGDHSVMFIGREHGGLTRAVSESGYPAGAKELAEKVDFRRQFFPWHRQGLKSGPLLSAVCGTTIEPAEIGEKPVGPMGKTSGAEAQVLSLRHLRRD